MIILADSVLIGTTHSAWLDGNSNTLTEGNADGGDGTISISNATRLQTAALATGIGTWSQFANGAGVGQWITLVPDTSVAAPPPIGANVTADLYESGSFVRTLGTFAIDANAKVLVLPWDATALADITGAGVELRLTSDAQVDIGAVEWSAAYSTTGTPSTGAEAWGLVLM
jgi:hypothetical protein